MKKLIAISVVFALAVGAAFAVDIGGTVIGTVNVIEADSADGSEVTASGGFNRLRFEGGGEVADGKFGGWLRLGDGGSPGFSGLAYWKPIDQLKLTIGGNPDGFWGKEGVTGWMFYQHTYDTGIVIPGNVWGWGPWYSDKYPGEDDPIGNSGSINMYGQGVITRNAFFGGFGGNGLLLEIKPFDVLGINIAIPFFEGGEAAKVFSHIIAQVDLNFSFGNIALTYKGGQGYKADGADTYGYDDPSTFFLYFGLTAIENLGLDVGLSYTLPTVKDDETINRPLGIGLGVKYAAGSFGVKFRTVFSLGGSTVPKVGDTGEDRFAMLLDVLPYFSINDSLRIFVSAGLGITAATKVESDTYDLLSAFTGKDYVKAQVGWHVNPYVEIGEEWGPKFFAGIKLWSRGLDIGLATDATPATVNFSIPIALAVSF